MKNSVLTSVSFVAFFFCFANTLSAQTKVTWRGGAPGQPNEWNCPKNWSSYRVPDEFSDVVIPDVTTTTFAAPVIKSGSFEVNSLLLESNAKLTIGKGAQLMVHSVENGFKQDSRLQGKGSLLILDSAIVGASKYGFAQATHFD